MNPNPFSFQFDTRLDVEFLQELFDGDMEYAATVFGDFLQGLPLYWSEVETAFRQEDTLALRAAVHKCKTLFGYVGHSEVLEAFQTFEGLCDHARDFHQLRESYFALVRMKESAEMLILSEFERLKDFCQIN